MAETKKVTGEVEINPENLAQIYQEVKSIPNFKKRIDLSLYKSTSEIIEILLGGSTALDASDLHIEPGEEKTKLRIRIDGILQDVTLLPKKNYSAILSRLKLLSRIKLNVANRPQDGRFSILLEGSEIEIRTSTIPAEYGESVVMRFLNPKKIITIEQLGLREDLLKIFEKEIKKPNGMIIITGPTGSGKTTTLYAFLTKIRNPEIKIITIEDPIEYHLEGISQTQVMPEKGYDFPSGLRAIVRQDPDVILVGEIRDLETASIALQASLTGHLVLSTLHTNDAAGTIARLQALGEKSVNIAPAINMAVAQRLVRRICKKCALFEKISPELLQAVKRELKNLPPQIKVPDLFPEIKIPSKKGCSDCNFTGYRGRIALFESFLVDDEMEQYILTSPSISGLRKKAVSKGMITMRQDGLIRVLEGVTTIEEVERVVGAEDQTN